MYTDSSRSELYCCACVLPFPVPLCTNREAAKMQTFYYRVDIQPYNIAS